MDTNDYHRREIQDVIDAGPTYGGNYRLKVTGAGSSKWLTVTPAQVEALLSAVFPEDQQARALAAVEALESTLTSEANDVIQRAPTAEEALRLTLSYSAAIVSAVADLNHVETSGRKTTVARRIVESIHGEGSL